MMSTPVCIKLHNFKKFKVEHEGQLYELAATSSENLLSEFQKYKPEVKQLLVARPMIAEDFDGLAEGSVVFASTQSYITEAQMHASETALENGPPHQLAIEYKTPSSSSSYSSAITSYNNNSSPVAGANNEQKLRSDLSMVDNFCSPPHGFVEAPLDQLGPIDTIEIAGRVRDILEKYKISQTLFSKYVIRRSQGTTSDLLRSPKSWDRMSEEGRIPYRRMKSWLEGNLSHNIQTLIRIKQGHEVIPQAFTQKGMRTKFTDEQREALELFFAENPRLTHDILETFAHDHSLTISAVRNWVNNRKQRMKRNFPIFEEDGEKLQRKSDKQLCLEGNSPQPRSLSAQSSLSSTHENHDMDCPTGIPTMVSVSTPMTFNHSSDNNVMVDRLKTEQQDNHVTAANVFEAAATVSKTEPDLEKYFPTHAAVWEKNNTG